MMSNGKPTHELVVIPDTEEHMEEGKSPCAGCSFDWDGRKDREVNQKGCDLAISNTGVDCLDYDIRFLVQPITPTPMSDTQDK